MTFNKDSIGVVGFGFVGEALEKGMKHAFKVLVYDPFKFPNLVARQSVDGLDVVATIDALTDQCEVIFVCVPTPMNADGSASIETVESVVSLIAGFRRKNVVVIKSTVPPGTTQRLHHKFGTWYNEETCHGWSGGLEGVVFSPEFLTEANYIDDFKNQTRIILGCEDNAPKTIVKQVFQRAYPKVPTIKTHPTIAEMVKYTTNCFLATKVAFANEVSQICGRLDIDYDKVIEYARYDERLGSTHWAVPGPDGHRGFGLSCLPKDLNALKFKSRELGVDPKVMEAVWQKNLEVRSEQDRDWERMPKAVVNPKRGID